jgi:hypothetical protein
MSDTTGHEPALSGAFERTGNEPELSSARPKCDEGHTMQRNLVGAWVCMTCMRTHHKMGMVKPARVRLESDPEWFNAAAKTVAEQQIRHVRMGLHPMGSRLTTIEGAKCGNCASLYEHRVAGTYFKCMQHDMTHGPGTDIRKGWQGCIKWDTRDDGPADGGHTGY